MSRKSDAVSEAKELILKSDQIVVVGHVSPDGDVIGSMLGLGKALEKLGKQCSLILPDSLPTMFSFLPGFTSLLSCPKHLGEADLVVALDSSDCTRFGEVYADNSQLFQATPILNIDHHITNQLFGTVNWVDPEAAAVAELVYLLLKELDITIDVNAATCLLTGIVADTRCFRTPSTTPRTMAITTELMRIGASLSQIADWVYNTKKLSTLQLWVKVLSTLESSAGVVWAEVTQEDLRAAGSNREGQNGLVNLLLSVKESRAAVVLTETPEHLIDVSLRSQPGLDVSATAVRLGGGGHPQAAGLTLRMTMDEARELVRSTLLASLAEQDGAARAEGAQRRPVRA